MGRIKRTLGWLMPLLLIVGFTFYAGYFFEAWTGFPKGVDVYCRMTRVKYILDFFPHVNWQYHWANGLPTFTTEGPFFYYLGAILVWLTGISVETSMIILGMVSFLLLGGGIYGYVWFSTSNRGAGLAAAFLVLSSFSTWSWLVQGGIYPRIFAVGLMAVALWLTAWLRKLEGIDASRLKVVLILVLAALILSHVLIGLITFAAVFFQVFFSKSINKSRLPFLLQVFGGSVALSAFFYLPLVLGLSDSSSRFIGVSSPVLPMAVASLWHYGELGPVLLPVLILVFLFSRKLKGKGADGQSLKPLIIMLGCFIFYGFVGYTGLSGKYYYINGFIPFSAALFLCFFGALIAGLLLGRLLTAANKKRRLWGFGLLGLTLLATIAVIPLNVRWHRFYNMKFDRLFIYDSSHPRRTPKITQEMGDFPLKEYQYRFAPFDALEAVWFNYVYQTPQERDYYGQGILHQDWRYWFEQALWNPKFTPQETKMALDWFSVRWFTEAIPNLGPANRPIETVLQEFPSRYYDSPDLKFIQSGFIDWTMLLRFENPTPSPILAATNAAPVLFIGDEAGFALLFRNLALLNLNSQKIIPLLGRRYVDDYQLNELSPFKTIFLYHYRYRQKDKAYQLLQAYLNQGGNIIWETVGSPDAAGFLPEPAPVSQIKEKEVKQAWNYHLADEILAANIDLSTFSPLIYNDNIWKLSSASAADLRQNAKGLLGKQGEWVAASRTYGQGKVIWTGFNFLYHISMDKNLNEAKLMENILDWLGFLEEAEPVDFKAEFVNPEKRIVNLSQPVKGVLFKENYYPKWHSYLEGVGSQKIFQAGPGMMYVLLPAKTEFPATLVFKYRYAWVDWAGIIISLLTLAFLVYYYFKGKLLFRLPFLKTMGSWWDKEE